MKNTMGVRIGNLHSYTDFGIEWFNLDLGMPEIKTHYKELPLESKVIDLTESVTGKPEYGQRPIRMYFGQEDRSPAAWLKLTSRIGSAFHGKRLPITFDYDPEYFYLGRIECEPKKKSFAVSIYTLSAECDPYKYRHTLSSASLETGAQQITVSGDMEVCPTFTASVEGMTVSVNGGAARTVLAIENFSIPEILLSPGINTITVKGSGTLLLQWREGYI